MPTIEEKLNTFDKVIVEDAIRARDLIRNQLHRESAQRIAEIKDEIRRKAEQERRREEIKAEMDKDSRISKTSVDSRKMLINARNDILTSVLSDLEAKLADFTRTELYDGYMLRNMREAFEWAGIKTDSGDADGRGYVLGMTARDCEKYAETAQKFVPGITVQPDGKEMIGGVRVSNAGAGVFVDNSLKKKVELCADELFLMSGLTIDK